jgi:hypothetical protein
MVDAKAAQAEADAAMQDTPIQKDGRFWTDWLYSGTQYPFCCSTQVPSLGSVDNTFSSVQRT